MKFDLLVKIQIAETAIRSCTTITLAWLGFSYMSMAWASVAAAAVVALCTYSFGGHYRVSGLGLKDWKRVLHFGSFRTVSDLARQVGDQSTSIVIGRMLGLPSAGYYSRGYGIVNIFQSSFVSAVGSVAFPAYAKKHRESDSAPTLFRRSMALMTGVSWPLFSYAALMAYPIIHLAFGNQWDASIPLMRWLCIAAIVGTLIYQVNGLLTAMGRYREVTIIELFYQPARIVLTMVAAFHSLEAVAASQIVAYIFAVYLYYRKLIRIDELRIGLLIPSIAPSAILAICTSLSPILVIFFWPGPMADHFLPAFIVSSVCSGLIWLFGMFIIKHPLSQEISKAVSMIGARLQLFSRGGNSDSS